jgi:hypothetical protein
MDQLRSTELQTYQFCARRRIASNKVGTSRRALPVRIRPRLSFAASTPTRSLVGSLTKSELPSSVILPELSVRRTSLRTLDSLTVAPLVETSFSGVVYCAFPSLFVK